IDSAGTVSKRLTMTKLVSMCHQNIQDELGQFCNHILQAKKRVIINYENYEWKIVETYSIAL
ncbi:hypothetical protein C8R48DRAFT_580451, partial [Suillus tomentosus]